MLTSNTFGPAALLELFFFVLFFWLAFLADIFSALLKLVMRY